MLNASLTPNATKGATVTILSISLTQLQETVELFNLVSVASAVSNFAVARFWAGSTKKGASEHNAALPPPTTKDDMSQSSSPPQLTPQLCFSTTALRDFLRISRSSIDDSITQNLNALITPSRAGFDPSSTSTRQQSRPAGKRLIDARACTTFKQHVLLPSWQTRADVLNYCASVATSPDPEDPESVLREVESLHEREKVVDERLDPYSARFVPREARTEALAHLIRNERGVESIIRARTWGLVEERCGSSGVGWEEALSQWRTSHQHQQRHPKT